MDELRIHLFGGFLLERSGVTLPPIASRVGRSVFAYLVMNRNRPIQRDFLAGTFWPDVPQTRARRRLSQTLWQIQDVVNDGPTSYINATTDTLEFNTKAPYWLDVELFDTTFESAVAGGQDPQARRRDSMAVFRGCVDLYRGDFLEGFSDEWLSIEQEYYRVRYVTALRRLVDATKAEGAYDEALAHARRLSHHDPLSEDVHQEVMRLCFLLGRASEALGQYERLRSIWSEELGTEPSATSEALREKIIRQLNAGVRPTHADSRGPFLDYRARSAFVGREQERRDLVDSVEDVLAGSGGVVLIEGEPGVGKTRLAVETAEDAQWRGFEVSWGRCTERALRPFAALAEVFESLSPVRIDQLTELLAPVWLNEALRLTSKVVESSAAGSIPLRPAEESTRMKEAIVHTLGALGEIAPHLIVIDDVQWADPDTLSVLTQMGPRLANSRVMLLLIFRSEEARGDPTTWDVLRDLDRIAGMRRVVLSPLSVFELDDMIRRILGISTVDPEVSARLHKRAGGNPLFTLETLLAWRDEGLLDSQDPAEALKRQLNEEMLPVVPRVRSVIDARMSLLSEPARKTFEAAAVCGDAAGLRLLAAAADISRAEVATGVDELIHRGLLKDDPGDHYQIAHDQVRQVVYGRIKKAHRILLHLRVGEAMESIHPWDVESIGYHYRAAGAADRAAPRFVEAGRKAAELNAFVTAGQHFEAASGLATEAGWSPADRLDLLGDLEGVLDVLGRREDQRGVLEEMTELAEPGSIAYADVERRKTWHLAHSSEFKEARRMGERAVGSARESQDAASLASALISLGTTLRWSGAPLDAIAHLIEAVEVSSGDPRRRADALTELASTLVEVQRFDDVFNYLDQAVAVYEESGDLRGVAEIAGVQGRVLLQSGERDRAAERFRKAIRIDREIGYLHGEGVNLVNLSVLHQTLGRFADALPGYDQAARIFADLGNVRGEAMVLANAASGRHNLLGDDERALEDARRAMGHFVDIGDPAREAQCLEIIAGITFRQGRQDEAIALLGESLDALAGSGNMFLEGQHLRSLALMLVAHGEPDAAVGVLAKADRLCEEAGFQDLADELGSIRALALLSVGDVGEALIAARTAVEGLTEGVERPYLVHYRHALAALGAGHQDEADTAVETAYGSLRATLEGLSSDALEHAMAAVPEHADIARLAATVKPNTIEVLLPARTAPNGRRLEPGDLRQVTWTIQHPSDDAVGSAIEQRRHRLVRLLTEAEASGAVPSIANLAEALDVSESTIGRDLEALSAQGHDVATRGKIFRAS